MKQNGIIKVKGNQRLAAFILAAATAANLQAQAFTISVHDAQFTKPVIERLVEEYSRLNPDFHAEVVKAAQEQTDANVTLNADTKGSEATVGRFVVLPVANEHSQLLAVKKVQRGLSDKLEKQLFVQPDVEEEILANDDGVKQLPGTVYSLTGRKAVTTQVLARQLKTSPSRLRGKRIMGREENLLDVVRTTDDAVSYNVANLIYDVNSRQPLTGIAVLPVDLDGNGKVSDQEREAVNNLDTLTEFIGAHPAEKAPVGNVDIITDKPQLKEFVNWTRTQGHRILAQYGLLAAERQLALAE